MIKRFTTGSAGLCLLGSLLLGTARVEAALIPYALVLQVDSILSAVCNPNAAGHKFGCDVRPGDIFIGTFKVDESLLSRKGNNLRDSIFDFFLQIGSVVWDQNNPLCGITCPGVSSSDFAGFRGPTDNSQNSIGAAAPGFDVHGGAITNLRGGVFGGGDFPFVDFSLFAANRFSAADGIALAGTMLVGRSGAAMPEPGSLALLAIALGALALRARQRRKRA